MLEIFSFCTFVPKITIICTVPEILNEKDRVFLSFWAILSSLYHPFPLMILKIKILEKKKKRKNYLEILSFYTYMCTINEDHMIYGSWNIGCDRQNFLSFWAILCHFGSLTTQKIKILKLKKNTWRYYHFTNVYHKWQ